MFANNCCLLMVNLGLRHTNEFVPHNLDICVLIKDFQYCYIENEKAMKKIRI